MRKCHEPENHSFDKIESVPVHYLSDFFLDYNLYHMNHMIWTIFYEPYEMIHTIWSISYGPYFIYNRFLKISTAFFSCASNHRSHI